MIIDTVLFDLNEKYKYPAANNKTITHHGKLLDNTDKITTANITKAKTIYHVLPLSKYSQSYTFSSIL
jgi:hypothetical protein